MILLIAFMKKPPYFDVSSLWSVLSNTNNYWYMQYYKLLQLFCQEQL